MLCKIKSYNSIKKIVTLQFLSEIFLSVFFQFGKSKIGHSIIRSGHKFGVFLHLCL